MRHEVTLTMTPTPWWLRLRYAWLGLGTVADSLPMVWRLVHLLPYWPRRLHHRIATRYHFFWLPCPLCGHEFGGHEPGSSVPDPLRGEPMWVGICSRCTRRRNVGPASLPLAGDAV